MSNNENYPVQITFRNIESTPAIQEKVQDRVNRLHKYCQEIIHCRVVIEEPHKSHHKGNLYHVSVDISVPGEELAVSQHPGTHDSNKDLYVTIAEAFDAAERQLKTYADRRHGLVKRHNNTTPG